MPLGYLLGMILALMLRDMVGWRGVFYITGSIGILVAIVIFFGVREAARGRSEPEMADLKEIGVYRFDWKIALGLFRKRTLPLLFTQGFFGVFPWNVITYWFFRYLETERHYSSDAVLVTMVVAVLVLACGYFVGGAVGDFFFKRTPRGRLLVCTTAVLLGAILLLITLNLSLENQGLFLIMLSITALFIPFAAPNVVSSIYDVALPEVRSTALAIQYFIESAGAALAPLMAGLIAVRYSLQDAILIICVSTWVLCSIFFAFAAYFVPRDIETLRSQMRERAEKERAAHPGQSVV
jgi:MFS family permease